MMPNDLTITNVRPMAGPLSSITIVAGRIVSIGTGSSAPEAEAIDGGGAIALPGLVEAHTHLDKTLWGMGWHKHQAGPRLIDKIDTERALRSTLDIDPARQSGRQIALSVSKGTTHIRSHVDVDTEVGLAG